MGNRYEILKKNKRTVKIWDKCRIEKEYKSCAECAEHKTCKKYKEYLEYTQKRIEIACYRKCKKGRKRGEGIVWPFRIKEKRESEISQRTKRKYYKKTEVVNFAPEMVRLYYVSNGFNIFLEKYL